MTTLRTKLIVILCALATLSGFAAKRNTILSVKDTIKDNDIVFPESFETDTRELMKNWYLQNYAVLDADVEKRDAGEVSEEEYIKRLQAMPTTIEMPYNQIVRSYIDRYVKRNRTLVEEMLGMSLYYMPIFEQALEKEGMPLELKYLPVIESALNPNAVSRAGAGGLWQFMVGTGKGLGLEVNSLVDERRDPYRSSEKAAVLLKNLYNIYNDWSLAIAAYNCGPGNVNKALRRAGGEGKDFWEIYPYLPKETRGYVPAFIAANYVMTYFKRHNISPSLAKKPLITDTVGVKHRVHFNQVAKVLNMPIEEIRALNPQYRADVVPASSERSYKLCLPSTQVYSFIMSEDSIYNYRTDLYAQRGVVEPAGYSASSSNEDRPYTWETKTVTQHHKVRKGENLSRIASQYGMSKSQLASLNGLRGDKVQRGQVLKVQTTKKVKVYHERPQQSGEVSDDEIKVIHSEAQPTDEELENEQIAEVQRIEQEAKNAPKKSRRVTVEEVEKPAPEKPAKVEKVENSDQWRDRNERYAKKEKQVAREETYKKSHSSKSEEARKQDKKSKHDKKEDKKADKKGKKSKDAKEEKPGKGGEYTIKKGESLSVIAEKTGVSVSELQKANNIKGDKIKAGDNIKIPKAAKKSKGDSKKDSKKKKK